MGAYYVRVERKEFGMYTPSRNITTFHIAGFKNYDGALVLDKLKAGKKLKMVPERDNPHDPEAIQLYYKGTKLGYIPSEDNGLVSVLDFYGHKNVVEARIIQVDPERSPWHQVRVGLYITDKNK